LSKGRCASGFEPLLKPLAAIPGDEIEIIPEGIQVNGVLIQNSARLLTDVQGRPLPQVPQGKFRVGQGDIWLIATQNARSFDSRYFGPLPMTAIEGIAEPFLTSK